MSDTRSKFSSGSRREHVRSLQRGLQVIEILSENPEGLTLTEVARQSGLTRAGARRILHTLVTESYASETMRRFRLSTRLLTLARAFVGRSSLWHYAEPYMREVSQELNESCSAAVLDGGDVVYVARVASDRIMSVGLHVGTRLPAYCTSMGRVLLSELEQDDLVSLLGRVDIRAQTPKTLVGIPELCQAIADAKRQGYAIVDEELETGLRSIAVPLRDSNGSLVAAINVSTQSGRMSCADLEVGALTCLKQAASSIETYYAVQ